MPEDFITCSCLSRIRCFFMNGTFESSYKFHKFKKELEKTTLVRNNEPVALWFYHAITSDQIKKLRELELGTHVYSSEITEVGRIFHACPICYVKLPKSIRGKLMFHPKGFLCEYSDVVKYKQDIERVYLKNPLLQPK